MTRTWASLLAVLLLGCAYGEEDGPPDPPDTVPPVVHEVSLTLDSILQEGTLRIVASDIDGPVSIYCGAPFEGITSDSFIMVRPYAELRFSATPILRVTCGISQGHVALERQLSIGRPYELDTLPTIARGAPPVFVAGLPASWSHALSDDWGLTTLQVFVAPDTGTSCGLPAFPQDTSAITGQRKDTTLTITVSDPGPHCVVVGTKDDTFHQVSLGVVVNVLPAP